MAERKAIKNLKEDESILVLPADKGRLTVVMNIEDYIKKSNDILNDNYTYLPLKKDPTDQL